MAGQHGNQPEVTDKGRQFKPKADVFDLDGTLADLKDAEAHHKKRHKGFAEEAEEAPTIKKNVKKLKKAEKKGKDVVILTARSAEYRKETEKWLGKNDIHVNKLVMRPKGDAKTPDAKIKEQLYKKDIKNDYKVKKAYDDKSKNVKMLKKEGVDAKKV